MKKYDVRVHVTDQDLDIEVYALSEASARKLVADKLTSIDHNVQWVQKS